MSTHEIHLRSALKQNYLADALVWLYYSDLIPERLLTSRTRISDFNRTSLTIRLRYPICPKCRNIMHYQ